MSSADRPLRIVVVEPDPERARETSAALRGAGHEVTLASDAEDAAAKVREGGPDLVLLGRPRAEGGARDLARSLKADPDSSGPFVILSLRAGRSEGPGPTEVDGYIADTLGARELCLQIGAFGRVARLTRDLRQKTRAAQAKIEELARVEQEAEARARDLSEANAALVDSRRAALNLIDDALEARRAVEAVNAELQAEVAERRRVEDTLRKISAATDQSPVSVIVTNLAGDIEYVNPHFSRLTGYSLEEAKGNNPRILQSGDTPPQTYQRLWETIAAGGVWEGEFRNRKKNGELFWERAIISAVHDQAGDITSYVAVKEDITERKKTEQALRESEERHRLLADNASDVIWTMTTDGRFTYVSPSVERLTGFTSAEAMTRRLDDILLPASLAEARALIASAVHDLQQGPPKPGYRIEAEQRCKDGSTVWVEVTASVMLDGEGRFLAILGVGRDITERRAAQAKLATQLEELLRWQSAMLGREERVLELKREVNALSRRLGLPEPYGNHDPDVGKAAGS